jgi:hypothetical protein
MGDEKNAPHRIRFGVPYFLIIARMKHRRFGQVVDQLIF